MKYVASTGHAQKRSSLFSRLLKTGALTMGPLLGAELPMLSAGDWFLDTPWTDIPDHMVGTLLPSEPLRPRIRLLGGSSKLAKLAEERRRKAAGIEAPSSTPSTTLSSLDRLGKPKVTKENEHPIAAPEIKRYPIRKKREASPPPTEPIPPPSPTKPEEVKPSLRASPTMFGQTLSKKTAEPGQSVRMDFNKVLDLELDAESFTGPSPDDVIFHAQQHSKGLAK